MKQETNNMQTKEGLHAQGEWEAKPFISVTGKKYSIVSAYRIIGRVDKKEDAELITKAVNERQALLDSHRELLEALEYADRIMSSDKFPKYENSKPFANGLYQTIQTAINNAKNI